MYGYRLKNRVGLHLNADVQTKVKRMDNNKAVHMFQFTCLDYKTNSICLQMKKEWGNELILSDFRTKHSSTTPHRTLCRSLKGPSS